MDLEFYWLIAATAAFILLHTAVSSSPLRASLVKLLGEGPYLGLFSLASAGTLVWMSMAYSASPHVELWQASRPVRLVALALMAPVFVMLAAGLTTANPTGVGGAKQGRVEARDILRITRHPVQWSLLIWALLHVLVNGHAAALLFFGGIALLSAMGPILIDRKRRISMGADWEQFAAATSNIPFGAIAGGRNRMALGEIGWKGYVIGLGLYVLIVSLHPYVIGVGAY